MLFSIFSLRYGLNEFNSLPFELRSIIGTNTFSNHIGEYYKNRCHHSESAEKMCTSCGQNTQNYKTKNLRHPKINFINPINNLKQTNFQKLLLSLKDKKYTIPEISNIMDSSDIYNRSWE